MYWFELSSGAGKIPKNLDLGEYKCFYNKENTTKSKPYSFLCRKGEDIVGIIQYKRNYTEAIVYSVYYKEDYLNLIIESALNVLDNGLILFKENDNVKELVDKFYKDNFARFEEHEKYYLVGLQGGRFFAYEQRTMELEINRTLHFYPNINLSKLYFRLTKSFSIQEIEEKKEMILDKLYNSYNNIYKDLFSKDYIKIFIKYKKTYHNIPEEDFIKEKNKYSTKNNKYEKFLIDKGFTYKKNKLKDKTYNIEITNTNPYTSKCTFDIFWCREFNINLKYLKQNYGKYMNEKTNLTLYRFIMRFIKTYLNKSKYSVCLFDNNDKLFLDKETNVYSLIPRINKRYIDYFIKLGKFNIELGDILKSYEIINDYRETASEYKFIYGKLTQMAKVIGQEETKNVLIKIIEDIKYSRVKNVNYNSYLHDISLVIDKAVSQPFMTKKALLSYIYTIIPLFRMQKQPKHKDNYKNKCEVINKLENISNLFKTLELDKSAYKEFRKLVSMAIKKDKYEELSTCLDEGIIDLKEEIRIKKTAMYEKKLKLKLDDKRVVDYVQRLNRYSSNISIFTLINDFGSMVNKFIKGTYEGLFKEDYIYNHNISDIINIIKSSFKKKDKVAKRLYHDLKTSIGIDKVLNGELNIEEVNKVLDILIFRNLLPDRNLIYKYNIYGKIEHKCSPEFLICGNASVCCMSYESGIMKTYAKQKGFGVFNVYYKDRIIANSLIWINKDKTFVIDNIEVHPNYERFNKYIKEVYINLIDFVKKEYDVERVVQGTTYNDLKLYTKRSEKTQLDLQPLEVRVHSFYSDAYDNCYIVG